MEKHMAVCPYCGAGCKMNLMVENGRVIEAEGLPGVTNAVSYTHLDVYKRQCRLKARSSASSFASAAAFADGSWPPPSACCRNCLTANGSCACDAAKLQIARTA